MDILSTTILIIEGVVIVISLSIIVVLAFRRIKMKRQEKFEDRNN